MNKIIAFTLALSALSLQTATPASAGTSATQILEGVATASELAHAGASTLFAISPDFYNPGGLSKDFSVDFLKKLSGNINKLATYALLKPATTTQALTNILNTAALNKSWHIAPNWESREEFNIFAHELSIALARSVSIEIVRALQFGAIKKLLGPDVNRLAVRAAHIIASTITVGTIEIICNNFARQQKNDMTAALLFGQQFYRELAFHLAGEIIMRGVEHSDSPLDVTDASAA